MKITIEQDDGKTQEFDNVADCLICGVVVSPVKDENGNVRIHPFHLMQLGGVTEPLRSMIAQADRQIVRHETAVVAKGAFEEAVAQARQADENRRIAASLHNGGLRIVGP